MNPKPNDQDRLNFLTQFRCTLAFDGSIGQWNVKMGKGVALGKNPRQAIDEAIKWTKKSS